jgi:hypothetical protein
MTRMGAEDRGQRTVEAGKQETQENRKEETTN